MTKNEKKKKGSKQKSNFLKKIFNKKNLVGFLSEFIMIFLGFILLSYFFEEKQMKLFSLIPISPVWTIIIVLFVSFILYYLKTVLDKEK